MRHPVGNHLCLVRKNKSEERGIRKVCVLFEIRVAEVCSCIFVLSLFRFRNQSIARKSIH